MYGLSARQWWQIFAILSRYGSRIDWVKLFGSRARGDYKSVSDVDGYCQCGKSGDTAAIGF